MGFLKSEFLEQNIYQVVTQVFHNNLVYQDLFFLFLIFF